MYMAIHSRDDVEGQYVSRKEGRGRLTNIEYIVDASIQRLEDNIEKYRGIQITATKTIQTSTEQR